MPGKPKNLTFLAPIELRAAADGKPVKFRMTAYGGGLMNVAPWSLPVCIDLNGLELPDRLPILADHENRLDSMVGNGIPQVSAGKLIVTGTLVNTPAGQQAAELIRAGVQASLGAEPKRFRRVPEKEIVSVNGQKITSPAGGMYLIETGRLREVSLTPAGADDSTEVAIAARAAEGVKMSEPIATTTVTDPDAIRAEERARVAEINTIAAGYPEIRAKAITDGWTANETELRTLRASRDEQAVGALRDGRPKVSGARGTAGGADDSKVWQAAFLIRAGCAAVGEKQLGAEIMNHAADRQVRSFMDLAALSLRMKGLDVPNNTNEMVAAAFSTGDMPKLLREGINQILLAGYNEIPSSWTGIANVVPLDDFRATPLARPLFNGSFHPVGPTGELQHLNFGEDAYSLKAGTEGAHIVYTRQDVINDNTGALGQTAQQMGQIGRRAVNDLVWSIVLANKDSAGNDFFAEANGNYLDGSETALSVPALGIALANMAKRTNRDGKTIDVRGRTLVVCPELEMAARSILSSELLQRYVSAEVDAQPQGNPLKNLLELVVEPRLSNAIYPNKSETAWYLWAPPACAALTVGFVGGQNVPFVEQVQLPSDVLGIGFRAYIDVGASLGDPLGALMMAGA